MAKEFNIAGICFPEDHYMADVSKKLEDVYKMVEKGTYFIINRPRQYGKTTTLYTLRNLLTQSGQYLVFSTSFEGISDKNFEDESMFAPTFVKLLAKSVQSHDPDMAVFLREKATTIADLDDLDYFITNFAHDTDKKVVVLIDEVDKSSNNQLFISFLAMLRNKYLDRKDNKTFHSVVLAGVHDVKSLKLKISPSSEKKYNSPWNIAVDFKVDMNLQVSEIKPMLAEYSTDKDVKMDTQRIAERLFFYTSGYPYLVSKMCKILDDEVMPTKEVKEWTEADVNQAFQLILQEEKNTNFETLMKNLHDNPELYQLVFEILIEGEVVDFSLDNPLINWGSLHGIFARSEKGTLMIHNRIYRERIANMMISVWRTSNLLQSKSTAKGYEVSSQYRMPNNSLDMEKILTNFQAFMREQFSEKDRKFLEHNGRLIFLSFLKPIINGGGYDFKEPQISEERRLDVVITYFQHRYVAELKIWYGEVAHEEGLQQLADYLDRLGLSVGYLLIFDHSKRKSWKKDWVDVKGKRIFWVRV